MKSIYKRLFSEIDVRKMMRDTEALYSIERGMTFPCYHASAQKACEILRETGIPNVEKIAFPADGKTAFQDKITPIAWDATIGRVTILSAKGYAPGTVIADFASQPFNLIKGSTGTAVGGERMPIFTYEQMLSGTDVSGALVMLPNASLSCARCIPLILNLGAKGFINDFAMNAAAEPDGVQWCNAFTEHATWHTIAADRPFTAFSISPNEGKRLRAAIADGGVTAHVECDGRRYEDTIDLVTALVPGRRKEEFWIFAHLYEPLSNDNSAGVAAAIETARMIQSHGTPEFSLRVIFGLEHYGFAAYAVHRGNRNLSSDVIGAIDYDAMRLRDDWIVRLRCASPALPFHGNYYLPMLADDLKDMPDVPKMLFLNSFDCMYDDDSFLGDSTTGVPTVWPIRYGENQLWHNSMQEMPYIHPEAFGVGCAINATFVDAVVNPRERFLTRIHDCARRQLEAEKERIVGSAREHLMRRGETLAHDAEDFGRIFNRDISAVADAIRKMAEEIANGFSDKLPQSESRSRAEQIVPKRATVGLPFDMAQVPLPQRHRLPGSTLYSPMAAILSEMDGKRNLAEIIRIVEHQICRLLPNKEIDGVIAAIDYLREYGYLI
ncbi:MAG: hypothetical protein J5833_08010 [Victivallales bacterium]|nr:hypothetical protein [Victivallales bacterium]